MSKRKESFEIKKLEVADSQEYRKRAIVSNSFSNLSDILSDITLDIEKINTYIAAIDIIVRDKHTPFDEVNDIKDILGKAQRQSEKLERQYTDLLVFLSTTQNNLLAKSSDD
jgi:hypothetical protein